MTSRRTFLCALGATVLFYPLQSHAEETEVIIRGGRVVNADGILTADVRITGSTIAEVGRDLQSGTGARVIDAGGMLVLPGGVDPHTHLDPPLADDLTSGSQAALLGGITTVGTFAWPRKGEDLLAALARQEARVAGQAIAGSGRRRRCTTRITMR